MAGRFFLAAGFAADLAAAFFLGAERLAGLRSLDSSSSSSESETDEDEDKDSDEDPEVGGCEVHCTALHCTAH